MHGVILNCIWLCLCRPWSFRLSLKAIRMSAFSLLCFQLPEIMRLWKAVYTHAELVKHTDIQTSMVTISSMRMNTTILKLSGENTMHRVGKDSRRKRAFAGLRVHIDTTTSGLHSIVSSSEYSQYLLLKSSLVTMLLTTLAQTLVPCSFLVSPTL